MNDRSFEIASIVSLLFVSTGLLTLAVPRLRRAVMAVNGIAAAVAAVLVDGTLPTVVLATIALLVVVWFALGAQPITFGRH